MRKRLYQALPENAELIDNAKSATQEKTKKRFYTEDGKRAAESKPCNTNCFTPMNGYIALTADNLESICASFKEYEKEVKRIPLALYGSRCHFVTTSAKLLDWYWRSGKVALQTGYALSPMPYPWLR